MQRISSILGIIVISILAQNDINLVLKFPAVVILLFVEALCFMGDKILISYSFESKNMFAHKNNNLISYFQLIEKVILYFTFVGSFVFGVSSVFIKLFYLCIAIIQMVKISILVL